jgi:cellulose synthase/poly-beta-1,6-N-acetylglucosamine synthase-like glycosyltransferase
MTGDVLFLVSVLWLGYVYFGYPAGLWVLARVWRRTPAQRHDFLPAVSVLISARNEGKDIGWKVRETLAWDYPPDRLQILVASDASEDCTDEILREISDPRLIFVRMQERGGKNAALNQLAGMATGDLLFFTDANSHVATHCLRRMVRYFADSRVGCVTGVEENPADANDRAMASGARAFLDYERLAKTLEGKLGSVLICDGAIFCIRRSLYSDVQPDLANDLELPLRIGHAGYWIMCEPEARAVEKGTSSSQEEFSRRRRISAQGILAMWKLRKCLVGFRGLQFVSRKLLRWFAVIPLLTALVSGAILRERPLFAAFLLLQSGFYLLAVAGWVADSAGRTTSRMFSFPFYFVLVNIAALWGIAEACAGRRFQVWEVPSLSRGRSDAIT